VLISSGFKLPTDQHGWDTWGQDALMGEFVGGILAIDSPTVVVGVAADEEALAQNTRRMRQDGVIHLRGFLKLAFCKAL